MNFFHDFKFALRGMIQKPAFALLTASIMTIGLGLCVFNYSFIYGLMYKALPFENGDRMYVINLVSNGIEFNGGSVIPADYIAMRDELDGIEEIGAYYRATVDISGGERTLRETATFTMAEMFEYTSVQPLLGRTFNSEDNQPGAEKVVVIGHNFWQNQMGGQRDVINQNLTIDGEQTRIIGVMPEGYLFPSSINIWLPIQRNLETIERNDYIGMEVFLLLEEGYAISKLNAQLATLMTRLEQEYPETNTGNGALAKNFRMSQVGNGGNVITVAMMMAVVFIMMLACTNVANLLLARASERSKETAIRVALGAPRQRLIMQMMWESLIICVTGGVFAILAAGWGLQLTKEIMAGVFNGPLPFFWQFELDMHMVWVTVAIVVVTTIITGLIPALKISNGDFNATLRDGTRGAQSRSAGRVSKFLVILEITLSCALLTVAAALALSINITDNRDYGANTENKLVSRIELPERNYPEEQDRVVFYQDLIREMEAQPEIARASLAGNLPGNGAWYTRIALEGRDNSDMSKLPRANVTNMMPNMLSILDIKPIAGRLFDENDSIGKPVQVIVTDTFALQNFDSLEAAIGQRFQLAQTEEESKWFTIAGVVPHVIFGQPYADFAHRPSIITNSQQDALNFMRLVVEPNGDIPAENLESTVSRVLFQLDKDVAPYNFRTYDAIIKRNTAGMNFISDIFNLFAIAALVLAASGIYGVMTNLIARRTQEFGIRRALGATDQSVMKMLMKQGAWQLFIGASVGAPIAFLLGSQMVNMLGASSIWVDAVYIAMPALIGIVVLVSTYLPTRRAILLEPSSALRYE